MKMAGAVRPGHFQLGFILSDLSAPASNDGTETVTCRRLEVDVTDEG